MKTVMPLVATSTGIVTHLLQPGSALETGDELCAVEVEDPPLGEGDPSRSPASSRGSRRASSPGPLRDDSALVKFNVNSTGIIQLLAGYDFNKNDDPGDAAPRRSSAPCASPRTISRRPNRRCPRRADKAALAELAEIENLIVTPSRSRRGRG